ncbi:hypothetical protein GCM10028792_18640 [Salinisphaera aquimarina]
MTLTESPSTIDLSALTAELAASVALAKREGINDYTAAWRLRLTVDRYRAIAEFLGERDRGLKLGYLTGRRVRPRGHLRIPRAHDLRSIFRSIDASLQNGSLNAAILRRWLLRQLAVEGLELVFDAEAASLAQAVRLHKRAVINMEGKYMLSVNLQDSDRTLLLLIAAAISWLQR